MNTTSPSVPRAHSSAPQANTIPHAIAPASASISPIRPDAAGTWALVLGGGGSTGNAWLIGVLAGLSDAGLDVTTADLTIGTSAGSTAAAQVAGATPVELLNAILDAPRPPVVPHRSDVVGLPRLAGDGVTRPGTGGSAPRRRTADPDGRTPAGAASAHLERMRSIIADADGIADLRRRMGAVALEAEATSNATRQAAWRATVASRLPHGSWPDRRMLITAVDARSGEPVAFDQCSGVELVDAVAASCAGGAFAYRIGDGFYIDGGYRSNADNADLAAGYARVLVLSPLSGRSLHPRDWGTHLATQVDALRAAGSQVETVYPDAASEHLFGANAMDVSLRPAAARVGFDQGRRLAERLAAAGWPTSAPRG